MKAIDLIPYLSKDHLRPAMMEIHYLDGFTYATNGYIAIRVRGKMKGAVTVEGYPQVQNLYWNLSPEFTEININESIFDGLDLSEPDDEIELKDQCGNCHGTGEHEDDVYFDGQFYGFTVECPVCEGDGVITHKDKVKAKELVRIEMPYGVGIDPKYLSIIFNTAKHAKKPLRLQKPVKANTNIWTCGDDITIMSMSLLSSPDYRTIEYINELK